MNFASVVTGKTPPPRAAKERQIKPIRANGPG